MPKFELPAYKNISMSRTLDIKKISFLLNQ